MKQVLQLSEIQFNKVTDKIKNCQMSRDQREVDLEEKLGPEKYDEDRYNTDKMLRLWLDIESELENFLDRLGYVYNYNHDKFLYMQKKGANW